MSFFDNARQDARYAFRAIRFSPRFASVAVLCLALGAGANTAMFQLLNAIRLRSLPVAAPEELVEIRVDDMTHARGAWLREPSLTNPLWEALRRDVNAFSGMFAWADDTVDVSTTGEGRKASVLWVSGNLFPALRVRPAMGRLFTMADDVRGCGPGAGVVLSYRFWQQEYGGDASIVGRRVQLGSIRPAVLGVTPPAFFGLEVGRTFDIAIPICAEPAWHGVNARLDSGTVWWLTVMARLPHAMSARQASSVLAAASPQVFASTLPAGYPPASVQPYLGMKLVALPASTGISRLRTQYAQSLELLLAVTSLVLLIACVNLAHLMVARTTGRKREIAVRVALGASPIRLAQQVLAETVMLVAFGVVLGMAVAWALCRILVSQLATSATTIFLDLSIDSHTFTYLMLLSAVVSAVFASIPIRSSVTTPAAAVLGGQRGGVKDRAIRVMLATQVALSLPLLCGTLLFVRTLQRLEAIDAGFSPAGVIVADVNFSALKLPADRVVSYRRDLIARVRAHPLVAAASEVLILPIAGGNWNNRVWMDDSDAEHARVVMRNMIGDGYFRTLGTPLLAGRDFDEADMTASARKVAIVNERFVHDLGVERPAVGRHVWIETTPLEPRAQYEIVGVVADTKYHDLREDDQPILYVPLWQSALRRPAGQFVIRSKRPGDPILPAMAVTLADTRYSLRRFSTLVESSLTRERLMAAVASPLGALAIVLTALGVYGICAYLIAQRTREVAIRVALGANRRLVMRHMFGHFGTVIVFGVTGGLFATVALARTVSSLLYGVTPTDPASVGISAAVIAGIGCLAIYVPARRATRIDPAVALREST